MHAALLAVLEPALEAARRALRDLDGGQVPNDLRRVAGYSGRLPRPLQRSLARGLQQYDWLREQAAAHLPEGDDGDPRREASRLLLEQPDGWGIRLAELAAGRAETAAAESAGSVDARVHELEAAAKHTRDKARAKAREAQRTIADLERRLAAAAAERKAEAAAEAKGEQAAAREAADAARRAERLQQERDEAVMEARDARQALHAERAARRKAEAEAAGAVEVAGWADDPGALADRLDLVARMARPPASRPTPAAAAPAATAWTLPGRVHPDRREAIDWLLGTAGSGVVLVDGYNLGYTMPGDQTPGAARLRVLPMLQRLHTMAGGRLRVTVVFDSSIGPADAPPVPGPLTVVFSAAGETADDDLVRRAGEAAGPVVVISDDRLVRERSEARGAIALWCRALIEWASSR